MADGQSVSSVRDEVNLLLGRGEALLAVKAAVSALEKPEDFEERFDVFLYALQGANRTGNVAIPKGDLSMQEEDLMMEFLYKGVVDSRNTHTHTQRLERNTRVIRQSRSM